MASAFTPHERKQIVSALEKAAADCAAAIGMKKTTVEQLAQAAGISKSAFYKFYDCKEMLFLDVLEELHTQMYGSAMRVMERHMDLSQRERTALAIKQVMRELDTHRMSAFLRDDLPALLRKLPPEVLKTRYHSDEDHIQRLLEKGKIELKCSLTTACTLIMLLMVSLLSKGLFQSQAYDEAIDVLINGACWQLVGE